MDMIFCSALLYKIPLHVNRLVSKLGYSSSLFYGHLHRLGYQTNIQALRNFLITWNYPLLPFITRILPSYYLKLPFITILKTVIIATGKASGE